MFKAKAAFSGFSVDDLKKAKEFYTEILGLKLKSQDMGLEFQLPGGGSVFVYDKDDHKPATFTILNFVVDDIDKTMEDLKTKGIMFEHYHNKDLPQDEKGVLRGLSANMGPDIAWFKDPAENVLSIIQDK